eukprot:1195439-Prorocentrum_minimum.AAC.2
MACWVHPCRFWHRRTRAHRGEERVHVVAELALAGADEDLAEAEAHPLAVVLRVVMRQPGGQDRHDLRQHVVAELPHLKPTSARRCEPQEGSRGGLHAIWRGLEGVCTRFGGV